MRIQKAATFFALNTENIGLTHQMQLCQNQERTMSHTSCSAYGLKGNAAKALEQRIQMRQLVIRTHYYAYESIQEANSKNIAMLSALPDSITPGVLDTEECADEINKAQQAIWDLTYSRDEQIDRLSQPKAIPDTQYTQQNIYATINYYNSLIAPYEERIQDYRNRQDKAYAYAAASQDIYAQAQGYINGILKQSTSAVNNCIATGHYDKATYKNLLKGINDFKIKEATPYLTPDELLAYTQALADGAITDDDLYDASGTFNTTLYAALAKLPQSLVEPDEVDATAQAYNRMWINNDDKAIEDLFRLSYVPYDPLASYDQTADGRAPYPTYYFGEESFACYSQSSLLDRISTTLQQDMHLHDKADKDYYSYLAAASLMDCVAGTNPYLWAYKNTGVQVVLITTPIWVNGETATIATLQFNPELNPKADNLNTEASDAYDSFHAAFNPTFLSVSGDINTTYESLFEYQHDEISKEQYDEAYKEYLAGTDIGQLWQIYGSAVALALLSKFIPYVGSLISTATLSMQWSLGYQNAQEGWIKAQELNKEQKDYSKARIGAYTDGGSVLSEFGYSLNAYTDGSPYPDETNMVKPQIYISDEGRSVIDKLVDVYNADPDNTTSQGYAIDTFIKDMTYDTYDSVISDTHNTPNSTYGFVHWCGEAADLVDKESGMDANPGDAISNFVFSKRATDFEDREYYWRYNRDANAQPGDS